MNRIPLTRPFTGQAEIDGARRVIESGWLTMGPEVAAFESEFATAVTTPHACAVSSGTAGLYLALRAAGVGPGDEVITVSHTFIATVDAIRFCGAFPVLVDIHGDSFNMAPELIEPALSPRTKAILCVHQIGMPADLSAILAIARRHELPVIEDAACALGSEVLQAEEWQRIGRPHGDAAVFSFHPRKAITTGDGGMITTRHVDWDRRFRLLRQHGMSVQAHDRHRSDQIVFERYVEPGFNFRMTDLQAAVGRAQLARLDEIVGRRRALAARYDELLAGIDAIRLPKNTSGARSNWQSYAIRLLPPLQQRPVMEQMLAAGISTHRGVMCVHREPAYPHGTWRCVKKPLCDSCGPERCEKLLESERAQDESVMLPLFPGMTEEEQDRVVAALRKVCQAMS